MAKRHRVTKTGGRNLKDTHQHFLDEHLKVVFRRAGRGQPVEASVTVYLISEKEAKRKDHRCNFLKVRDVIICPRWPGC